MPIYDLKCNRCYRRWEHIDVGDLVAPECPLCGYSDYKHMIAVTAPHIVRKTIHQIELATDVTPLPDYAEEIEKSGIVEEVLHDVATKPPEHFKKLEEEEKRNKPKDADLNFPKLPDPLY